MRKQNILVCVDKIKDLHSGLGRVSIDYASQLSETDVFDITFLVHSSFQGDKLYGCPVIKLTNFRKYLSFYMSRFDLVHLLYQSPKYSYACAKKVLMTIHDLNYLYTKSSKKQIKYKRRTMKSIRRVDALCFISKFSRTDCISNFPVVKSKTSKVIYNGSSPVVLDTNRPKWLPVTDFLFSVGIFTEKKNFHTLVDFMSLVDAKYQLVISGDSSTAYGKQIKSMIIAAKLQDRILLSGKITEEEKGYLYRNCSAFVFPSLAEGFGLPVIEAMSVAKPVFCSDKTSLSEIGDKFAYFWESFEADQMARVFHDGMVSFNTDSSKIEAQVKYAQSFTWQKNVDDYIKFYTEILKDDK